MYILSMTRKKSSEVTSQGGIRCSECVEGCSNSVASTAPDSDPGVRAGFVASESDVSSGCWDILRFRTPPLISA
jgi:hypothetical protein